MGDGGYELLWGAKTRPARGRPPALSRERIVAEALAIADAEGLQQVSMKHLAERLGSGVMSLYRHVPGKDELVALMYDATMTDPPRLPEGEGWRAAMTAWALAVRDLFHAHPWALALATANHAMGPGEARWLDTALGVFEAEGLPAEICLAAVMAVNGYVGGAVRPEIQGQDDPHWFRFLQHESAREDYPHVYRLVAENSFTVPTVDVFGFGLERVLDGLERYIEDHR
ncbi:TetR/AcrR family transcriptional regulator [Glycomyces sp. NPDC046736]|uniref:TetR/AcrR family transcriptional regulator n=1 Tax=Glycomyces sp. NPDC046736 TaxID=3155615 RepID=UPI0033D144A4